MKKPITEKKPKVKEKVAPKVKAAPKPKVKAKPKVAVKFVPPPPKEKKVRVSTKRKPKNSAKIFPVVSEDVDTIDAILEAGVDLSEIPETAVIEIPVVAIEKKVRKSKGRDYISNADMLGSLLEWQDDYNALKAKGKKAPIIPDYLMRCFILLANKYSHKSSFAYYTYISDMKAEAVNNCIIKALLFNKEKSSNPFAYFTQIIHNTFLQYIKKEKYQSVVKDSLFKQMEMQYRNGNRRKSPVGHEADEDFRTGSIPIWKILGGR